MRISLRNSLLSAGVLLALTVWACDDKPTEPTPVCTFAISPASQSFTSTGGTGTVTVTASDTSCAWSASSNAPWVTLAATSGTGSGTLNYTVAANATTAPRSAAVSISGQTHSIAQEASQPPPPDCEVLTTISPVTASIGDEATTGSIAVTTSGGCAWTATSNAAWIAVTSGQSGTGNGTVTYSVQANNANTQRIGTITIGPRTFTLTQSGEAVACEYSVAPVQFNPCMPPGTLTTTVTSPASCQWTVTPNVSWLTVLTGESGSGTGPITFAFTANYDPPREGLLMVRWPTPTAGQNVRVSQAGCFYAVSESVFNIVAAGSTENFFVYSVSEPNTCGGALQDRCLWTATTDVPWITITTSMPRMGDDRVTFVVAENLGSSPRTGTITVRDKVVHITQAGK